jgi:apolipoprotein N-acyltransferase
VTLLRAVAAGVLLALAFPPFDLWPASFLAVAALSLLIRGTRGRRAALVGLAFGLGFFGLLLRWMLVVGPAPAVGLVLLEAVFFAPLGLALARTSRARWWPLWHAAVWVLVEGARARVPFGGMPWGRLAFAQADSPLAGLAAVGGSPLVSFAAAGVSTALAAALLALRRRALRPAAVGALLAAAVACLGAAVPTPTTGTREVTVALIQGDVPREGLSPRAQQQRVFNNHVDATRQLADEIHAGRTPRPDMVIWPENGSDLDPYLDRPTRARIDAMVDDLGAPTLIGAVLDAGPRHVRNSGILWTPGEGPGAKYTKRHPVPFGEYIPFRGLFTRLVGQLALVPRDFLPGREVGVLDIAGTRVGAVICFEVAYDGLVRDAVRAGGGLLVVQTNNATYGRTGQPDQQLAISRLRSIEHGRAMVIASTSGISGVIAPDGTVRARSREFTRDVIVAAVPVRTSHTLATDVGARPEAALCLLGVGAIVICRPRRTSGMGAPPAATVIEPATVLATPGDTEGR